ncbi:hypothetical protein B0F90DRAFT_1703371 [Multifurca ochricompacta]|uniref:RING-type domain-containing protein n=1 Tax=Multifurca ochricompacta TaxID=376703 RepID=A0AAD4QQF6_9AGAM|nr:hypothetical protein B0F90DRAFT_1703371 [Multifurca ochricompacta]
MSSTSNRISAPGVPISAPTTPAYTTRSHKASSEGPPPVTPQRIPRAQRHHHQLQNYFRSPLTPSSTLSTPYTPLTLTTPASVTSLKRYNVTASPKIASYENSFDSQTMTRTDGEDSWRCRASENGIRVGSKNDESLVCDEVLSAPPILMQGRSRSRSQTSQVPFLSSQPPPHTPARRTLASLNTPSPRASNVDLLKIKGSLTDPAPTRRRSALGQTNLFDIDENNYVPYPSSFSHAEPLALPLSLNDPFDHTDISFETLEYPHGPKVSGYRTLEPAAPELCCSVCGSLGPSLAELEPCAHLLCSACLTSALNIVGRRTWSVLYARLGGSMSTAGTPRGRLTPGTLDGFNTENLISDFHFFDLQGSSTPNRNERHHLLRDGELPVLRIDKSLGYVDITPPTVVAWLKHPVQRVHVLLDRKGKTLSHAYVEMPDEEAARASLRTAQNSVLGKGKRARGVTVTRSCQEELMKALFPSWQGPFDGCRPSLGGLSNEQVVSALEHGLVSEAELKALLHLIRSPDSHFLKVPSLPFYSLISMLSKFPADADSRLFWSSASRDLLFAAIQVLTSSDRKRAMNTPELLAQLLKVAVTCDVFTVEQRRKFSNFVDIHQPFFSHSPSSSISGHSFRQEPGTPEPMLSQGVLVASQSQRLPRATANSEFGELANQFGVEPRLVEALAQKLSGMC